jgi:hypothetical protein
MNAGGSSAPAGNLGLTVVRADGSVKPVTLVRSPAHEPGAIGRVLSLREVARFGLPRRGLSAEVNEWRARNFPNLARRLRRTQLARALRLPHFYGALYLRVLRANGDVVDLGLASVGVITTAGVNFIVDAFQNTTELENFKFHALGTGTNAEASSDTALQTEITTAYNPDSTRATGTTTEGASANIYRTVATNTVDGSAAITEHGILTQAATGGGTLLDRSVFSVVNLASGDGIQSTYDATFAAGG